MDIIYSNGVINMEKIYCIKDDNDKKYFTRRLNVIGGQIKGLTGMIEEERSYEEILIQLGALTNSLKTVGISILENYMRNNLDGKNQKEIDEIVNLYNKLV